MRSFRRSAIALIAAGALLLLAAGSAQAITWTPLSSTTTEEISAVDYHADGRIWFATTNGKLFTRSAAGTVTQGGNFPGRQFSDIAFNSTGTIGLATADLGWLYRTTNGGTSWSAVSLAGDSYDHTCPFSPSPPYSSSTPTANLLAVAWSSDTVAWVVSAARGQILRSANSGGNWGDASRQSDGACRINALVTDVAPVAGSANDLYFVDDDFATIWRTADGLASSAAERAEMVNCFSVGMSLAIDPSSPNRVSAAGACNGSLHWGFSSDGATNKNYVGSKSGARIRDIGAGPGVFISVGDAGLIEQTFNGTTVHSQPATGALETRDWRAISFADGARAVIGGVGGALAVTSQANQPPAGPPPPPPDTTVPGVSGVTVGSRTLRPGQGTTFGFNSNEAGRAVLTFEKRFNGLKGKRRGKRICLPRTKKRLGALRKKARGKKAYRKLLKKQACVGYKRIGSISQQVRAGRNTIVFNGRVAGRKLGAGQYRGKLVVTDTAGNRSRTEVLRFKVAKPKRR